MYKLYQLSYVAAEHISECLLYISWSSTLAVLSGLYIIAM